MMTAKTSKQEILHQWKKPNYFVGHGLLTGMSKYPDGC